MKMVRYWKIVPHKDSNLIVKNWYIFLLVFGLVACQAPQAPEKETPLPDWVIPEDKMTDILLDVHIIEGARIGKKVLGDSLYALDHYNKLWEKHQISKEHYDSSFDFYCQNAERMDRIYEDVILKLSEISSEQAATSPRHQDEEEEEEDD